MSVDDFRGLLPPNRSVNANGAWHSTPDSWIGNSSALVNTDTGPIGQGLLFKYDYNRSVALYLCPADHSPVRTVAGQVLSLRRTHSDSMSGCLGGRTNEV